MAHSLTKIPWPTCLDSPNMRAHFNFQTLFSSFLNVTLMAIRNAVSIKTEFGAK